VPVPFLSKEHKFLYVILRIFRALIIVRFTFNELKVYLLSDCEFTTKTISIWYKCNMTTQFIYNIHYFKHVYSYQEIVVQVNFAKKFRDQFDFLRNLSQIDLHPYW
jgi:hypothetical protein